MKKLIILFAFIFGVFSISIAQVNKKVDWSVEVEKTDNNVYLVNYIADLENGWYIYSQHIGEGGPFPTEFNFSGEGFKRKGEVEEYSDYTLDGFDSTFEMNVKKFGKKAVFSQYFIAKPNTTISTTIIFMSCNDEMCLPPKRVQLPVYISE